MFSRIASRILSAITPAKIIKRSNEDKVDKIRRQAVARVAWDHPYLSRERYYTEEDAKRLRDAVLHPKKKENFENELFL